MCEAFEKNLINFVKEYFSVKEILQKVQIMFENFDEDLFNFRIILENF